MRKLSMDTYLSAAFNEIFPEAKPYRSAYVTLYEVQSCYGGAEEGGWYYDWFTPIASQEVDPEHAHDFAHQVRNRAEGMTRDAKAAWADSMRSSCDWAEARGIDPADLPEPDGPTRFVVLVEEFPGQERTTERPQYC